VGVVRVTYMLRMDEINSGRSLKPNGTKIRVCFTAPEAGKDCWKCCGWEKVKGSILCVLACLK